MKRKYDSIFLNLAAILERCVAAIILLVVAACAALLVWKTISTFAAAPQSFSINDFLSMALIIVMGVEFVRMLVLHTPNAVIDVLLFAIARQMIVTHSDALETLLGVAAVAAIFAIKKYLTPRQPEPADEPDAPEQPQ